MANRLCIVMPVYNEQDAIGGVLEKWHAALESLGIDFEIRPYNDGSKDSSLEVMQNCAKKLGGRINVRDKPNGGHGNTVLAGYREAAADGFDWVFQIDSDDEMGPEKFGELWERRNDFDFLVGIRDGRRQALPRKVVSFVSRLCVRGFYGRSVWDVNTPYRLMRVSAFKDFFSQIPPTTFAPNVILSGLAARARLRCFETRVPQHDRMTGEVSIKKWKLLKAAMKSFWQTVYFGVKHVSPLKALCVAGLCGLACFAVFSLAYGIYRGMTSGGDFQYGATKALLLGENPYLATQQLKHFDGALCVANQLPSCLLLLAPFCIFSYKTSLVLWTLANLAFLLILLVVIYKAWFKSSLDICPASSFSVLLILLFSGRSLCTLISNGQHLLFSLAMFALAYVFNKKRKSILSGLFLACSAFKYTTIVPLAFIFVYEKAWKSIFTALIIHVILTMLSADIAHESPFALISQSFVVANKLLGEGEADMASAFVDFGLSASIVEVAALVGYMIGAILVCSVFFVKRNELLLKLSFLTTVSNVMFYHRVYDFITLVVPLIYIAQKSFVSRKDMIAIFLRFSVWLNIAFFWFITRYFVFTGMRYAPIGFVLHILMLTILIIESFNRHECDYMHKSVSEA